MNTAQILELAEQLDDDICDLEDNLEPLLTDSLSASTRKLPLLEKAKLYATIVYAIESLLFSFLRLHGVDAKQHAVFRELTRVKQYFEKIKETETGPTKPRENLTLNKQAAGRMIKHALAGNHKADLALAEVKAREALLARKKLEALEARHKARLEAEAAKSKTESEVVVPEQSNQEDGEVSEDEDGDDDDEPEDAGGMNVDADETSMSASTIPGLGLPSPSNKKRKQDPNKSTHSSPSKKKKRKSTK